MATNSLKDWMQLTLCMSWPVITHGAGECGKSTVHQQRGVLHVLFPVWLFLHSSAEFLICSTRIPQKMPWEIAVEILPSVVEMFFIVLKPSIELCFGCWSHSNLPHSTMTKVHQLAIFLIHLESYDGKNSQQALPTPILPEPWYSLISLRSCGGTWLTGAL